MTRREDHFRGEYGEDEPVTECSAAERNPGRAIIPATLLGIVVALGFIAWAIWWAVMR
jgi:hypothetical protein